MIASLCSPSHAEAAMQTHAGAFAPPQRPPPSLLRSHYDLSSVLGNPRPTRHFLCGKSPSGEHKTTRDDDLLRPHSAGQSYQNGTNRDVQRRGHHRLHPTSRYAEDPADNAMRKNLIVARVPAQGPTGPRARPPHPIRVPLPPPPPALPGRRAAPLNKPKKGPCHRATAYYTH